MVLIRQNVNSPLDWSSIQRSITTYTIIMAVGAACMAVGTFLYIWSYYDYSHIFLAILTAFAFGISTTALAIASVPIG